MFQNFRSSRKDRADPDPYQNTVITEFSSRSETELGRYVMAELGIYSFILWTKTVS